MFLFQNSDDDEATIAKEEDDHEDDELDLLKEESEIPVEELLRLYHPELYGSPQKAEPVAKVPRRERSEKPKEVVGEKSSTTDESEEKKPKAEENDDQVTNAALTRTKTRQLSKTSSHTRLY